VIDMTEKQRNQIEKRIKYFGQDEVQRYISFFFPNADINNLTKEQAQKVITGMRMNTIITNVYGRDYGRTI
jgi:hypothetical protein